MICKNIIDAFGGKIEVQSTEGQGSTFSFSMPIQETNIVKEDREWIELDDNSFGNNSRDIIFDHTNSN